MNRYRKIKHKEFALLEKVWFTLNSLTVVGVSVYFVLWQTLKERTPGYEFFANSMEGDLVVIVASVCLVLLNAAFLVASLATIEGRLVFSNEDGDTTVSLQAVEDALSSACDSIPEVSHLRVRFQVPKKGKGQLVLDVVGSINDLYDIRTVTQKIQQTLRSRLNKMLQIEEDIAFNVHFNKISSDPRKAARGKETTTKRIDRKSPHAAEHFPDQVVDDSVSFPIKYPVDDEIGA